VSKDPCRVITHATKTAASSDLSIAPGIALLSRPGSGSGSRLRPSDPARVVSWPQAHPVVCAALQSWAVCAGFGIAPTGDRLGADCLQLLDERRGQLLRSLV
jgi:hypothetical protein